MKRCVMLISAVALHGCTSTAAPNFYNGSYYLAGDKDCKHLSAISSTRATCFDKKGNATGYRDAMTDQQLQMWQYQAAQQRADIQKLTESVRDLGHSAQTWTESTTRQSQNYSAPQVQSVSPNNHVSGITYTRVGDMLLGSNGVTYRKVGNSIVGSDGTACQITTQHIVCR